MKKVFTILIILLVLAIIIDILNQLNIYNREGIISEINGATISVVDKNGDIWDFSTKDNLSYLEKGEKIRLIMHNNFTDNFIYDDRIINWERI